MLKLSSSFFFAGLLLLSSCTKVQENSLAVKVGEREWSSQEVQNYFRLRVKGALPFEQQNPEKIKKELLDEIILKSLVENWARRNKIQSPMLSLTPEERESFSRPKELFTALKSYKNYLALYDLLLKDFINKSPKPSLKEQKAFYKKNHISFVRPASCQLKQIAADKEGLIRTLQKRLTQGESFEQLSRNYSIQKQPGWVNKGDLELFDQACSRKIGSISPVLKSPYGYHIFKVTGKKPGRKQSFKASQKQIIQSLKTRQAKEQFSLWLKKELFKTTVWTNKKLLAKIRIQNKENKI